MSRNVIREASLLAALLFFFIPCYSQVEDPATGELLENFFRDSEQPSETDAQLLLENLENLRLHPMDLNRATREDLAALQLLNEIQIENFLAYRTQFGPFLNAYELQAIPAWDVTAIRRLLDFAEVPSVLDTRNIRLINGFTQGENELILRWGRSDPVSYGSKAEGGPDAFAFRFKHTFDNRMRFGLTAENDPGEAFFRKSNPHGFDFYSAHFFVQNVNRTVKSLALGDFSARLGQGLLMQSGFSAGKSAETTSIVRGGRKLRPYASFGETYFLRGAAATVQIAKNWEITALFSARHRDANIDTVDLEFPEQVFTSLQSSGLHRDSLEIADEKSIRELVAGISASRAWANGQVSLNALHLEYDSPWNPSPAPYRKYIFSGKQLTGVSIDYNWRRRNWYVFGEFARSDNGGIAAVNGLLFAADRHVTLALLHRALGREYQSIYGAPFAETSGASNEQGMYLGSDIRFGRKWQINAYADLWRHPWLRFAVSAPSTGSEYLGRIIWTPTRGVSFQALWFMETKERDYNSEGITNGLAENKRGRLRLHASYKISSAVELRSRVEWTSYQIANMPKTHGFLAYQEAVVRPLGSPVYGAVRVTIFDSQDYDTRIYTFENDLFSAISIPGFAGRGSRYFINLTWRVNKWLRLESRLDQTIQRVSVTSSGVTGRDTGWKLQARIQF